MDEKQSTPENNEVVDFEIFSKLLKDFSESSKSLSSDQIALLQRLSLLAQVEKNNIKAAEFLNQHKEEFKGIVLSLISESEISPELSRDLLKVFGENRVMSEIYDQFGKKYKLGATDKGTTDCVQILRQSPTFRGLTSQNPTRFFSEGSDLVLNEKLGKVVDIVDRKDFSRLTQYKPTKDKMYVFGLVKPPLYFNGKPNVTHLQISTDLQSKADKLAVIHASSDKGAVSIEVDVNEYLANKRFERVYVVEVDLKNPFVSNQFQREPYFSVRGHNEKEYKRPNIYDLPLTLDRFSIIGSEQTVDISEDERRTVENVGENRALEYLTVITGLREGKIGNLHASNIAESLAFRTFYNPEKHSVGLHQVTKIVMPLFAKWIEGIDEKKAASMGQDVHGLWLKRQKNGRVEWSDLIPYLNTYSMSQRKYENVTISTICAYLLLRHLYEDQLLSAYANYGEVFYGLEEQPEAMIAISAAYRSNMDVMVRGGQQFRIAEVAHRVGIIDKDFCFTEEAKKMPEYADYLRAVEKKNKKFGEKYYIDGYKGIQMQYVAFMCYKKLHPEGKLQFDKFEKAYATSQNAMLSSSNPVVATLKSDYKALFKKDPHLLMTEDELRGLTDLNTKKITFANEGLWVISHFRKMSEENWQNIMKDTSADGAANSIIEEALQERSLQTNEISKVDGKQGMRFRSLIENLQGNPWYKRYPELIMSACFVNGLFLKELKGKNDGVWIKESCELIKKMFEENLPQIERKLPKSLVLSEKTRAELAVASSVCSIDEIVKKINVDGVLPENVLETLSGNNGRKLDVYSKSFDAQRGHFALRDKRGLVRKSDLSEKEKQHAFVLKVFDAAKYEALSRGFTLDFALVATSMAALECGWGRERNEAGELTLHSAANNIFSIKYDYKQYDEPQYTYQNPAANYYIHHTKEYFDPTHPEKFSEHYEAFRKYDSIEDSVKDFFDLMQKKYPLTIDIAGSMNDCGEPSRENQEKILRTLFTEKYATDPSYVAKSLSVGSGVRNILLEYGQII